MKSHNILSSVDHKNWSQFFFNHMFEVSEFQYFLVANIEQSLFFWTFFFHLFWEWMVWTFQPCFHYSVKIFSVLRSQVVSRDVLLPPIKMHVFCEHFWLNFFVSPLLFCHSTTLSRQQGFIVQTLLTEQTHVTWITCDQKRSNWKG